MAQERGGGGERMEMGEAGPLLHFVQQSSRLSFAAQAQQWKLLAGIEEQRTTAPQSHISRW